MKLRNEIYLKEFGRNLKKLRQEKGVTQTQLSFNADVELSQIARIELGKINPTICTLKAIAEALEIEQKNLFDF